MFEPDFPFDAQHFCGLGHHHRCGIVDVWLADHCFSKANDSAPLDLSDRVVFNFLCVFLTLPFRLSRWPFQKPCKVSNLRAAFGRHSHFLKHLHFSFSDQVEVFVRLVLLRKHLILNAGDWLKHIAKRYLFRLCGLPQGELGNRSQEV